MHRPGDDHRAAAATDGDRHEDGLGHCRSAVVEAGVGHVHAGELGHQGLVLEDGLERTLRRLGLVGRVGGEELATRGEGVDGRGHEMVVAPAPEEARAEVGPDVAGGQRRQMPGQLQLGQGRRDRQRSFEPILGRDHIEQVIERSDPDHGEHLAHVVGRVQDIGHQDSVPKIGGVSAGRGLRLEALQVTLGQGQGAVVRRRVSARNPPPSPRRRRDRGVPIACRRPSL